MFDWFKNRQAAPVWRHPNDIKRKEMSKPESILPPDLVAKIKVEMVKYAAEVPKIQPVSQEVKNKLVIYYISKLPILFKESVIDSKDTTYFFGTHINGNVLQPQYIQACGGTEVIFEQLIPDLIAALSEIGIPVKYSNKSAIVINTKELKKFCNFEKLAALK